MPPLRQISHRRENLQIIDFGLNCRIFCLCAHGCARANLLHKNKPLLNYIEIFQNLKSFLETHIASSQEICAASINKRTLKFKILVQKMHIDCDLHLYKFHILKAFSIHMMLWLLMLSIKITTNPLLFCYITLR